MKLIFLIGGLVGFLLATITGLAAERAWDLVLRDSALACLVGALLFQWFWSFVVHAFTDLRRARIESARAVLAAAAEPAPAPSPTPAPPAAAPARAPGKPSTLATPPAAARAR
jgi:hypothetical protein